MDSLIGVRSSSRANLIAAILLLPPRRENEILVDDQTHRRSWADGDRRLDAQTALGHLIARARHVVLSGQPDRLHQIALPGQSEVCPNPEQGRQSDPLEQR